MFTDWALKTTKTKIVESLLLHQPHPVAHILDYECSQLVVGQDVTS